MKGVESIDNPNCVPISASCIVWNYGSIDYLGICNGAKLPTIIYEIVSKLQSIASEDLSTFDIDSLLDICKQKAPKEVNLISILTILKNNQLCLNDYINTLYEKIEELSKIGNVKVNLKCLADFDTFGNELNITRESLDQLVIDTLCKHEKRLDNVEGRIILLENATPDTSTILEPNITTCLDVTPKATSLQVKTVATEVCDIRTKLGPNTVPNPLLQASFANKAGTSYWNSSLFNAAFGSITGWLPIPTNEVDYQRNIYLMLANFQTRLNEIETNCCAPTCDKIKIGFSIVEDDNTLAEGDYVIRFRPTDGTSLFGFVSTNSKVKFGYYDKVTGIYVVTAELPINISETESVWENNSYNFNNFDLSKPVTIILTANMVKDGLTCQKCISQTIDLSSGCPVCEIVASGTKGGTGKVTITYEY
jgi:hypothetical protein